MRREQRRQLVALERPELEHERRARAPHAVGEPAHALGRRGLVGAVGREQQHPAVVEVVGEEDDQIERRRVGPVQVLEHEQHRRGGRALGEQRERRPRTPAAASPPPPAELAERPQRLDERLVGQLGADEVDRAPEQHLEAAVARARRELGGQPRLADARLPGDEHGGAASRPRRVERALELLELAERVRRTPRSRAPPCRQYRAVGARRQKIRRPRRKIRPAARCARAPARATIAADPTSKEDARWRPSQSAWTTHTVTGGGGLRLHVREWGEPDGPPILFIHGWSQNHLCWARQYESPLADEFRLVAFDLRGHGMSEAPLEPEHYTDGALWADDVAAIVDALGLDRPVLVGWSYGAFVICDYVRAHGQDRHRGDRLRRARRSSSARRRSAR